MSILSKGAFGFYPMLMKTLWSIIFLVLTAACSSLKSDVSPAAKSSARLRQGFVINQKKSAIYEDECGSCHIGYAAGLLPERSWKSILTGLENHFGQNAEIDEEARREISAYLKKYAADSVKASSQSKSLAAMIYPNEIPIRITETSFWKRKHGAIKRYVWRRKDIPSRSKCESCHHDAGRGIFDERTVQIPK